VIAELLSQIASLENKGADQQKSITRLRDELKKTRNQLKELREQFEEAHRSAHRQAAPFRVDEKKRQLGSAVIARKVSCGNRTERGAQTREILASLVATWTQRGRSVRELITAAAQIAP